MFIEPRRFEHPQYYAIKAIIICDKCDKEGTDMGCDARWCETCEIWWDQYEC